MWETEKKFSDYLHRRLNAEGVYVHRLESHGTGNGLPDMFIMGHGKDYFLELKNNKKLTVRSVLTSGIKVDWRPGQQAWAWTYKQRHTTPTHDKVTATVVGLKDGFVIIPMIKMFEGNVVFPSYIYTVGDKVKVFDFLNTLCNIERLPDAKETNS